MSISSIFVCKRTSFLIFSISVSVFSSYQQAASGLVITDQGAYELSDNYYDTYGFEYIPGAPEDSAHVTWLRSSTSAWRLDAAAIGPNPRVEIGQRHIPDEPLYLIINLGLSSGFSVSKNG